MYSDVDDFMDEYPYLTSIEKILEDVTESEEYEDDDVAVEKSFSKYKLITKRIDFPKIHHKKETGMRVNVSTCEKMKLVGEGNTRSGAIIYTHYLGRTYFCLGVDSDYGDLTDFAGGVKKTDVNDSGNGSVVVGGLRELREESLGVFPNLTPEQVAHELVFWTNNMAIMFIYLSVNPNEITRNFQEKFANHPNRNDLEVSEIKWLPVEDFRDAILSRGQRMYSRVRKILSQVVSIIEAL